MRCPTFIGRREELRVLDNAVRMAATGRGSWITITGEAGVGKSRLAAEAARMVHDRSGRAVRGRASSVDRSTPYRPLGEAVLAATAGKERPQDPDLEPYLPAVARFVPHWPRTTDLAMHESPAVVGESLLRVLSWLAGDAPLGVVLEDLHWADVDTLAVCDYVIDHVETVGVVMLATARDSEAPAESRDLFARATVVALGPLSPTEIASMADACVGGVCPPDDVAQVQRSSGGLPLLVEDLLGETSRFDDLISRRVRDLPIEAQQVVIAAALIGERFAPADVAAALAISSTAVGAQLATAADAQLVVAEDDSAEVTFRHARTRDVALAARPEIAAGLRSAVAAALEVSALDDTAVRAAELWCECGQPQRASELFRRGACRSAAAGALDTASRLFARAAATARPGPDHDRIAAQQLAVLVGHGRPEDALAIGLPLLDRPAIDVEVRLDVARALLDVGRLDEARSVLKRCDDDAPRLVLEARAALLEGAADRRVVAEHLAHQAAARAEAAGQAEVACEALDIVARCARTRSLSDGATALERALVIAEGASSPATRLRLLNELGTIDMLREADGTRLGRARQAALAAGALDLAVGIDVNIAALHAMRNELGEARTIAARAGNDAARLGLKTLAAAALTMAAVSDGFEGRRPEMEARLRQAAQLAPFDADLRAFASGAGRGVCALVREERDTAIAAFRDAIQPDRPIGSLDTAYAPLLVTLTAAGQASDDDLAHAIANATPGAGWSDLWVGYGEAAVHRDEGALVAADQAGRRHPLFRAIALRLIAEAALRDQWGTPVEWLRDAEAVFVAGGQTRIAAACRSLLRQAGASSTRRRGDDKHVDPQLLRLGVTAREAAVLELIAERLGNKEIAARLFLSPRTVEKHVASLVAKLGVTDRAGLIAASNR